STTAERVPGVHISLLLRNFVTSTSSALATRQLFTEVAQRGTDRLHRVLVVGMGRAPWCLEVGPLAERPAPLPVGPSDEVPQEVLRSERQPDALREHGERVIVVAEQVFFDVTE